MSGVLLGYPSTTKLLGEFEGMTLYECIERLQTLSLGDDIDGKDIRKILWGLVKAVRMIELRLPANSVLDGENRDRVTKEE